MLCSVGVDYTASCEVHRDAAAFVRDGTWSTDVVVIAIIVRSTRNSSCYSHSKALHRSDAVVDLPYRQRTNLRHSIR